MPDLNPSLLELVATWLKWIGLTSASGAIALYSAWLAFPPEIVVDAVSDKSKKYSSESTLKLKNIGKLPALYIVSTVRNLGVTLAGIRMSDCQIVNPPSAIPRMAGGESAEITVAPGIAVDGGAKYSAFSYELELNYSARAFFLRRTFSKRWLVELRNTGEEFSWLVKIGGKS